MYILVFIFSETKQYYLLTKYITFIDDLKLDTHNCTLNGSSKITLNTQIQNIVRRHFLNALSLIFLAETCELHHEVVHLSLCHNFEYDLH